MANPEHIKILKQGTEVWNKWRLANPTVRPDFTGANFTGVNFAGSNFTGVTFAEVDLSGANLSKTDLSGADLSWAHLNFAKLLGTNLNETNLENAVIHETVFTDVNLSNTKGLNKLRPLGPSIVDHRTLIQSENLPDKFLRDCGLPEPFIEYLPSLIGSLEPIQFYSCFISHSSKDEAFAHRLHADLQAKGIRCWYAPENLKIGDEIQPTIDKAIRVHEKLLLIFSENSITSSWVRKEAHEAMTTEKNKGKKDVLFPIRLDDSILNTAEQWCDDVKRERHIGDFRNWTDHDTYQKSLDRLLRDLKNEASEELGSPDSL
ncbi:MAG: toll/interleukin-1 receptor domain-containing protein [Nitrospinaceae bacterium]|nr:toll/interleukin-1 receptor domain-containing protein [Nitrospina sp.]MBT5869299.1 toll/interleukin-1 receptor domain-containing protein [Nitrospinaceae bacterium]